jgi:ferredoxin-NADP reductase
MFAILERIETLTDDISTYWFRPEKPFMFVAGEYTELYLPHADADSHGERRWFSFSSSPTDALFSITTKFGRTDHSSFKKHLQILKPGSRHHFADPMGDFVLPKNKDIPLLFIAAGIGVTPIYSMVRHLGNTHEKRNVSILYAVRIENDLVFADTLQAYAQENYTPIVTEPGSSWQGETGRITAERILKTLGNASDVNIYMSGPEQMIESLRRDLINKGITSHRIVSDNFLGYTTA